MKTQGGIRVICCTLSLTSALDGVSAQRHAPAALPPENRPGTHFTRGYVAPGPVRTDAKNLTPTRIRYTDRPPHIVSPYRLRFPGPLNKTDCKKKNGR